MDSICLLPQLINKCILIDIFQHCKPISVKPWRFKPPSLPQGLAWHTMAVDSKFSN